MTLPVDLDREEARDLAERELANPRYDRDPPVWQRAIEWVVERLSDLVSSARGVLDGPMGALLLALVILVVAVIVLRYGQPAGRRRSAAESVLGGTRRTAEEYRAAAEAAAANGHWRESVIERFRAIIGDLDERGILHVRPGMTAAEAAWSAGLSLPDLAGSLSNAATLFDAVHYGGHGATRHDYRDVAILDEAVRRARPLHAAETEAANP